eukprot:Skav225227  [mRNA]  locus=scaffold2946:24188:25646:- [translate_table: standard]
MPARTFFVLCSFFLFFLDARTDCINDRCHHCRFGMLQMMQDAAGCRLQSLGWQNHLGLFLFLMLAILLDSGIKLGHGAHLLPICLCG